MKGSSERWPKRWLNDDHFLSFSVLTDTSPQRESSKTTSLLVRNHSFFMAAAAFSSVAACSAASAFATSSFQSLAHFMSTTPNPQERWGTHKKRWPFQPCPFADVIGLVRRSYVYILTFVSASIHHSKAPVKQTPRSTDGAPKKYAQSMTCGAFKVYPNPKAPNWGWI